MTYTLAVGPIPDGAVVMHMCDNPPCCNPDHLRLGTIEYNNTDCVEKKRNRFGVGESVGTSVATAEVVIAIRSRKRAGENWRVVMQDYSHIFCRGGFRSVWDGKTWKHLLDPLS